MFFQKLLSSTVNNIEMRNLKIQINSFVFYCFINFLCILLFLFLMYFFVFVNFYVSEVYLDKFQDKHDEAKGLEGTI